MTTTMTVDAARVELLLSELRLPSMKAILAQARGAIRQGGLASRKVPRCAG